MAIDKIFSKADGYVQALVTELRTANMERNTLRLGMQTIIDLKAGGEAEQIARQILEEFGGIRSSNPDCPIPDLVYQVGPASLFASHAREYRNGWKKIPGEI